MQDNRIENTTESTMHRAERIALKKRGFRTMKKH